MMKIGQSAHKNFLSYYKFKVDVQDINSTFGAPFLCSHMNNIKLPVLFLNGSFFFVIIFLKKVHLSMVENFRFDQVG